MAPRLTPRFLRPAVLLTLLGAIGTGCRASRSTLPPPPAIAPFPAASRPDDGALSALGPDRLRTLLLEPARGLFDAQYGAQGLTPYTPAAVRTPDGSTAPALDLELQAWIGRSDASTLVVIGQDSSAGTTALAKLEHDLALASQTGPVAVPLELELLELLEPAERAAGVDRTTLAVRALERRTGARLEPSRVTRDLEARALLLVVTDFDRAAELVGPAGAQRLLNSLSAGPGRLLLTARPVWFDMRSSADRELAPQAAEGADRAGGTAVPRGGASGSTMLDIDQLLIEPLTDTELNRAATALRPDAGQDWPARFAAWPPARTLARQPALTAMVLDVLADPVQLEPLRPSPDAWHLLQTWTRGRLEASLGEGQLSAVERAEQALAHFAGRLYLAGRLELPLEGPEEAPLNADAAGSLVGPRGLLRCGPAGCRFTQRLIQDYFTARALRLPLEPKGAATAANLLATLDRRRPGAGPLAFLASGLDELAAPDELIEAALSEPAPAPPFALEALLRLRALREGLAAADGSMTDTDTRPILPVVFHAPESQTFWRQVYAKEDERLKDAAAAQVTKFLKTRAGRRYRRDPVSAHLLRDRDGSRWAWVPAGRAIVGSYLAADEDPARWIEIKEPFLLAIHLVSNERFQKFVRSGTYKPHPPWIDAQWARFLAGWHHDAAGAPDAYPDGHADHPVIHVSWNDARAYCAWRTRTDKVSTDLPLEDEWEYAARGSLGRRYPWGDRFDPERSNTGEGGRWQTTPIGLYAGRGEGPLGNLDMAGNVWEWTGSTFDREAPASESSRVLRGGGWRSEPMDVRSSRRLRGDPNGRYDVVGIRLKRAVK
jgi:formylglycine-generating enzyme required for sulfatase activity